MRRWEERTDQGNQVQVYLEAAESRYPKDLTLTTVSKSP
jgi:hypothetical protein